MTVEDSITHAMQISQIPKNQLRPDQCEQLGDWGDCGNYAIALQRIYGGKLMAVIKEYLDYGDEDDENGDLIENEPEEKKCIEHIIVQFPTRLIDVRFIYPTEEIFWQLAFPDYRCEDDHITDLYLRETSETEIMTTLTQYTRTDRIEFLMQQFQTGQLTLPTKIAGGESLRQKKRKPICKTGSNSKKNI